MCVVTQRLSAEIDDAAPRLEYHRLSGRRIPLTGGTAAHIEVTAPFCQQSELERAANADALLRTEPLEHTVEHRVPVRSTAEDAQRRRRGGAYLNRYPAAVAVAAEGTRSAGRRIQQAHGRGIDHAQHRLAGLDQGDVDRELPVALDELTRAIQWVDQPERGPGSPLSEHLGRRLLAQHADLRGQLGEAG